MGEGREGRSDGEREERAGEDHPGWWWQTFPTGELTLGTVWWKLFWKLLEAPTPP